MASLQKVASQQVTPKGNPLPPVVHATLTKDEIGKGRVIVIGDIHGCDRELEALLTKCEHEQDVDTVVSVGDLVGKGPHSIKVLRAAQRLGIKTVRGNWDENSLSAICAAKDTGVYEEKFKYLRKAEEQDIAYMQSMPFSLSIPSHGCIVAHAGLVPGLPLQEQDLYDLIEMRHVDLVDPPGEGEPPLPPQKWKALPKFPREAGHPWATVWPGPEHIIFGHHARRRLQAASHASGIDTGCCLGDQLTALVLPRLSELEARGWTPANCKEGVTREEIGAKLVSVNAREQYVKDDKE